MLRAVSFWSDIYHESIVEHDPRLRSFCTQIPLINFDGIIDVDWVAAKNDVRIASHPIAIYLNKLAPKSQQLKRKNKDLIYKRHELVTNSTIDFGLRNTKGMFLCSKIKISPRKSWLKLYERNPRFASTTSALSTQLYKTIQAQSRFLDKSAPAVTTARGFLNTSDRYPKCYKVCIYHRQTWNHLEGGGSFPSIWKEPDPSAWIDDGSGVALSHITLLCRDMICECSKCTTGCSVDYVSRCCDTCRLDHGNQVLFHRELCGRLHVADIFRPE